MKPDPILPDETLNSAAHGKWCIVALESGMSPQDIEAVMKTRLRLLAAARLCQEVGAPANQVVAVMREISTEVDRPLSWPTF